LWIIVNVICVYYPDALKEKIGSGGFGDVFAIDNPYTKKKMVMKIMNLERLQSDEKEKENVLKSLDAELRVGVRIARGNPYLLQITEYFTENGYSFLIMEYCSKGDFKRLLQKNKKEKVKMSRKV
jgi:serine/threonine protein kinase